MALEKASVRFGRELARLRKQAGLTQSAFGRAVGMSKSHVSNVERGHRRPPQRLIAKMDELLATGDYLARLWPELTGDGRQAWLEEFTTLLKEADAVYDYQNMVFPGYLQTEAYTRAIVRNGAPWLTPDEVTDRVQERAGYAAAVMQAARPIIWVVLDETVVQRRYGSPAVMREQLLHVIDLIERDRLTLQLVPAGSPGHPGVSGTFTLLTGTPDVAYAESIHEGQTITSASDNARYRLLFGALQAAARDRQGTLDVLRTELERLDDNE